MTMALSYRMGKQIAKSVFKKPPKKCAIKKLVEEKLYLFNSKEEVKQFKKGIKDYLVELEKEKREEEEELARKKSLPLYKEQSLYSGTDNTSVWSFLSILMFGHP